MAQFAQLLPHPQFIIAPSIDPLSEKNIAIARDQNPLTKLPGNTLITAYISETLNDLENTYVYVYFDFDNFKPFNDSYGFRIGDRAILLSRCETCGECVSRCPSGALVFRDCRQATHEAAPCT